MFSKGLFAVVALLVDLGGPGCLTGEGEIPFPRYWSLGSLGRSWMPKTNRPFSTQQHPVRFGLNPDLTAKKWLEIDWQFANRNCYRLSRVSRALAQISCFKLSWPRRRFIFFHMLPEISREWVWKECLKVLETFLNFYCRKLWPLWRNQPSNGIKCSRGGDKWKDAATVRGALPPHRPIASASARRVVTDRQTQTICG